MARIWLNGFPVYDWTLEDGKNLAQRVSGLRSNSIADIRSFKHNLRQNRHPFLNVSGLDQASSKST